MSFEEQLRNEKENGIVAVGNLLKELSKSDLQIAANLDKQNKSLKEMWKFILQEAKKKATSGSYGTTDQEVLEWAVHYYDEDNIKIDNSVKAKTVVDDTDMKKEVVSKKKKSDVVEGQLSLF